MPNIEELLKYFGDSQNWQNQGDEWASEWGSSQMEWLWVIQPRIQSFIPSNTILEIAPGFGRWTQFLKNFCENMIAVDLAENCIEHCKKRFAGSTAIDFFVNDGKTLNMVEDNSIDFIFSFDSLVHVEMNILDSYIEEFARILKPNGVAFIHHSNMGSYQKEMEEEVLNPHARSTSVTYQKVIDSCEKNNLRCITQEKVNWGNSPEYLIDCFSVICRKNAYLHHAYKLYENGLFMLEAQASRRIYESYSDAVQPPKTIKVDMNNICSVAPCQEKKKYEELLRVKDSLLQEKDSLLQVKDSLMQEKDSLLQEKDSLLQGKDKLINDLLNSRSWKFTAPLRSVFRFLRTFSR